MRFIPISGAAYIDQRFWKDFPCTAIEPGNRDHSRSNTVMAALLPRSSVFELLILKEDEILGVLE